MNTRDTSVRQNKAGQDLMWKAAMLFVSLICCILVTTSGTWLTSKGVVAVGGVPVLVNAVSKDDIQNAKNKRDAARAEADEASEMISQLEDQRTDLEGELSKLNEASDAQREQYVIIYGQLEAALEEKAKALDEFIVAQENLEAQQKVFTDRVTVMFEYQNKSTLEVLLESDSIAGFFTNMELITLIADADAQAIDMLQVALDDAELQADISADIEGLFGIVPPPHVKELIQGPAAEKLDGGGEDHAAEKEHQPVFCVHICRDGIKHRKYRQHAEPVDGADRAVEKPPVDHFSQGQGMIGYLHAPSQDGIGDEKPKYLIECHVSD